MTILAELEAAGLNVVETLAAEITPTISAELPKLVEAAIAAALTKLAAKAPAAAKLAKS